MYDYNQCCNMSLSDRAKEEYYRYSIPNQNAFMMGFTGQGFITLMKRIEAIEGKIDALDNKLSAIIILLNDRENNHE